MKNRKRILSLLLVLTMFLSLLPLSAFAEEDGWDGVGIGADELQDPPAPEEGEEEREELFAEEAPCEHVPGQAVTENVVSPSCTEPGRHDEVVYCALCSEELSRVTLEDPAPGHTPAEAVTENEVKAAGTEPGRHDEVVYCALCFEELSRVTVEDPAAEEFDAVTADAGEDLPAEAAEFTADGEPGAAEVGDWAGLTAAAASGGSYVLTADIEAKAITSSQYLLILSKEMTLDLNGHVIFCGDLGCLIAVMPGGDLTLTDGNPSAVNTVGGSTVYGGVITGGANPGGMGGGAVYMTGGVFTMNGGTIIGNSASYGGGVYVTEGSFTMNGGAVIGNSASYGGGVYVGGGSFTMNGGAVTGNSGGGVQVGSGSFSVSGAPVITDNLKNGRTENVFLSNKTLTVAGALTNTTPIGVTTVPYPAPAQGVSAVVFTSGLKDHGTAANFVSDDEAFTAVTNADGEAQLITVWDALQARFDEASENAALPTEISLTADLDPGADCGPLVIPAGRYVALDLNGHVIRRGVVTDGGDGSTIVVLGALTVTDSNPTAEHTPAVTYSDPGSPGHPEVTVTGGVITGGISETASRVYVASGGSLTLAGGTIVFTEAVNGGGVYVASGGSFTMKSGMIAGNGAEGSGGGVYVDSSAGFAMEGGTIAGNAAVMSGGGVYVDPAGSFSVSGAPVIRSNYLETDGGAVLSNVHLGAGSTITVSGTLTNTAPVSVTTEAVPTAEAPVVITSGLSGRGTAANFASDDDSFAVGLNADGEAILGIPFEISAAAGITAPASAPAGAHVVIAPEDGFLFADGSLSAVYGDNQPLPLKQGTGDTANTWSFTMPAANVSLTVDPESVLTPWAWLQEKLNAGGAVTLTQDIVASDGDGCLTVPSGKTVTLDLNGHTIDRGLSAAAADGSVFSVEGKLTVTDSSRDGSGLITGGWSSSAPGAGGVLVSGSFILKGGTISGNTGMFGGGVAVILSGLFDMRGGAVSGNSAVASQEFDDATVELGFGGGVIVGEDGTFILSGGSITDNSAKSEGGGILADGSFTLSGAPVISGNTAGDGAASNVCLSEGTTISIADALTNETPIGVTALERPTAEEPAVFTLGLEGRGSDANFISDDPTLAAVLNANLECMLAVPLKLTLPDDSAAGTVRVAAVNGRAVDEPPEFFIRTDYVSLAVTPATGYAIDAENLYFTSAGSEERVALEQDDDGTWFLIMPAADAAVTAGFTRTAWGTLQDSLNAGGTITLTQDYTAGENDAPLTVPKGRRVVLDLNGHTIDRGLKAASEDGSVFVVEGNLTVTDGSQNGSGLITGGWSSSAAGGGGVLVSGIFVLEGGAISGNRAMLGAGVAVVLTGRFDMRGGAVSGNSAATELGGVTVGLGGGVLVGEDAAFILSGGSITDNSAASEGGGVLVDGDFTLSGAPVIRGNAVGNGAASNVCLYEGRTISVADELTNETPIGVTALDKPTAEDPAVFTLGLEGRGSDANFTSDDPSLVAVLNADLECMLAVPLRIRLPAVDSKGAVRITDVTGTPVVGDPPAWVLPFDEIALTLSPADGFVLADSGLRVTYIDAENRVTDVQLTQDETDVSVWRFVMPPADVTVTAVFAETSPSSLAMNRSYLALMPGQSAQLAPTGLAPDLADLLAWSSDSEDVAVVDAATGEVTAIGVGTAWITVSVDTGDGVLSARCRVDVAEGEGEEPMWSAISAMRLLDTKVTVKLYQLAYARLRVIPELTQNSLSAADADPAPVDDIPLPAEDRGVLIQGARFSDDTVNGLFALRVADDRTLEIVPTEAAILNPAGVMGNYKDLRIYVTVDGVEHSAGTLTLKIDKSMPKVRAGTVRLNSFFADEADLRDFITGGTVGKISVADLPEDWLRLDGTRLTYIGEPDAKKSVKLSAVAELEGWAVKVPVSVSVNASKTVPKLALKPASLRLQPGCGDFAAAAITVTPGMLPGTRLEILEILEGTQRRDNGGVLLAETDGQTLRVSEGSQPQADGKAHTYKVTLALMRGDEAAVTAALTVKLPASMSVSLTAKTEGTIDLAIPGSTATVVPTLKNYGGEAAFSVTELLNTSGSDAKKYFNVDGLTITAKDGLNPGKYFAVLRADFGGKNIELQVPFTVKRSANTPAAVLTLKTAGAIDVVRPGSAVTVTPTIRNFFGHELTAHDLVFYRVEGKALTPLGRGDEEEAIPFAVSVANGAFVLTQSRPVDHLTEKFAVGMEFDGIQTKKPVDLPVLMGKAGISQSDKAVTLLQLDRYDRAVIRLTPGEGLSEIAKVVAASPKDKNKRDAFELIELSGGEYAIGYNGKLLPAAGFKGGTVKLQVFLEGNVSGKPNATLSVSVKLV